MTSPLTKGVVRKTQNCVRTLWTDRNAYKSQEIQEDNGCPLGTGERTGMGRGKDIMQLCWVSHPCEMVSGQAVVTLGSSHMLHTVLSDSLPCCGNHNPVPVSRSL